jgi:hypothetical protein
MIPKLTTHWLPDHENTKKLVQELWSKIDTRKTGSKDNLVGERVVCGLLALRHLSEFQVDARQLTKAEKLAFDLIVERHIGFLIKRTRGKNIYKVAEDFPTTLVVESSKPVFRYNVIGNGVRYTTPEAVPSSESAILLNSSRSVICSVLDLSTSFQMLLNNQPFPARYKRLSEVPITDAAHNLTNDYLRFIDRELLHRDVLAFRLRPSPDLNKVTYMAATPAAIDFGHRLKNLAYRFSKLRNLDSIVPAVEFKQQSRDFLTVDFGRNETTTLSSYAGAEYAL